MVLANGKIMTDGVRSKNQTEPKESETGAIKPYVRKNFQQLIDNFWKVESYQNFLGVIW